MLLVVVLRITRGVSRGGLGFVVAHVPLARVARRAKVLGVPLGFAHGGEHDFEHVVLRADQVTRHAVLERHGEL